MAEREVVSVEPERWDQLYAPSASLAVVTTIDADGRVNAAAYGACTRVAHDPIAISFTVGVGRDTANNILATGEFVVNVPSFDRDQLERLCVTGRDFPPGVDELIEAGLTALPATRVRPPRIGEFGRHFECVVLTSTQWRDRLTVVGDVVAASCDAGFVDETGDLRWHVARPVTYCGGRYGLTFASLSERMTIDGPELMAGLRPTPAAYAWRRDA